MHDHPMTDRELELEAMASDLGVTRYTKERPMPWRAEAAARKYESDLKPGKELVKRSIEPFVKAITELVERTKSGKGGRGRPSVATKYISEFDAETVAFIAAKGIINGAAQQEGLTRVSMWIAQRLSDHHVYEQFSEQEPGLYRSTLKKLKKVGHDGHRRGVLNHALKLTSVKGLEWTDNDKLHTGVKLVDLFRESTGLVNVVTINEGKMRKDILQFTPEAKEWLDKMHSRCALLSPVYLPMVVPPVPWTNPLDGGYLDDRRLRLELLKTERKETLDELFSCQMPEVYAAVNAVQATPWRINKGVLTVAREAWDRGLTIAGLPARNDEEVPPRPADIPKDVPTKELTPEQQVRIKRWAKAAAVVHSRNAEQMGHRLGTMQKLWIAETFADDPAIYFPHTLDFRGRVYPVPALVNPQADDLGRGLIEFANGKRLGDSGGFWLAVHIANTFGFDKAPFAERVEWVWKNEAAILDSALRPLKGDGFWLSADKPWQFLAAAQEWAGYAVTGYSPDFVSHTPVQMDGSCSGLQHFSAMLLDPEGGAAVNLVPSETKNDIYGIVRGKVEAKLVEGGDPHGVLPFLTRAVVKRPTMTYAYSVTTRGMRDQILDELLKGGFSKETAFDASNHVAPIVRWAVEDTVKAAAGAMRFLQGCARVAAANGLPIRWTTPMGLPVLQDCRLVKGHRVMANFAGRQVWLTLAVNQRTIDKRAQSSGVAPNYVHSADASHLMLCVNGCLEAGVSDFSMIHDSFGVHPCDVDVLHAVLRETFVSLYSTDRLTQFREELVAQLPEELAAQLPAVPEKGELDLTGILRSDFAFA